jgi:hypothetical protein
MGDGMFKVLVLGGLALVGCGGATTTESGDNRQVGDASSDDGGSPARGTSTSEGGAQDSAYPSAVDSGDAAYIGFPDETPSPFLGTIASDASSDASSTPDGDPEASAPLPPCFPCEAP